MAGTREVTTTETNRIVERCISRGAREERREETGKNKTEKSLTEKYEKYLIFLSAIFLSFPAHPWLKKFPRLANILSHSSTKSAEGNSFEPRSGNFACGSAALGAVRFRLGINLC